VLDSRRIKMDSELEVDAWGRWRMVDVIAYMPAWARPDDAGTIDIGTEGSPDIESLEIKY
jgi:hypothetical protein